MRRALVGCLALSLGGGPIGTFLVIRRMSLMGDALSHAVLPGAALGFILGGLSLPAMSLGGAGAGLTVAFLSGLVTRLTPLREDASFAAFYLISLALGVLLVSTHGSNIDLLHLLFGSILAVDDAALILMGGIATASLLLLAVIYRPLVVECFDPGFLRAVGGRGALVHTLFLALVVLNLVAGFQALGTLMTVELIDVARRGGAILGARAVVAQRREQRIGIGRGLSRPPRLLSPGLASRRGREMASAILPFPPADAHIRGCPARTPALAARAAVPSMPPRAGACIRNDPRSASARRGDRSSPRPAHPQGEPGRRR